VTAIRSGRLTIVRTPGIGHRREAFAEDVRRGLLAGPKTLPCRYFYDATGSVLFEQICELPEYYLTRTEDGILRACADEMVAGWTRAPAIIELGSGSSTKTQRLIAAALQQYRTVHYLPIDVSPTILEESARALIGRFPGLRVTGLVGDYREAMTALCSGIRRPKLVMFLGSSLGNYEPEEAVEMLTAIAATFRPDDRFLLGTDLVKNRATLEAAYNDSRGVSAAFNRNVLARINRELGADFDIDLFSHEARYQTELRRVEMHLVSRADQVVTIRAPGIRVAFRSGESIHTENAYKYTRASLHEIADQSGFEEEAAWTDPRGWYRVQRWRPKS
jgi:dimethylhistidine N-methyltransferase